MTRSRHTPAASLALAALVSLTVLAGINQLSVSPAPAATVARINGYAQALQVVVVTARRAEQS